MYGIIWARFKSLFSTPYLQGQVETLGIIARDKDQIP